MGGKGEKMGGGEGVCGSGTPFPPPIFSPFSPGGAHHSAADVRRRRNLHLVLCVSIQRPVIPPKPLGEAEPQLARVRISEAEPPTENRENTLQS